MERTIIDQPAANITSSPETAGSQRRRQGLFTRAAGKSQRFWSRFWMQYAGPGPIGRTATRLATFGTTPYFGRVHLADLNSRGYVAPSAVIYHDNLRLGQHVFVGDNVVIYQRHRGGAVELNDKVHLYGDTSIYTGEGGSVRIGEESHIQQRCHFSSFLGSVRIGRRAEIAPNCAFYAHNHRMEAGKTIREQPIETRGGVIIDDDVWLGYAVIVLDGVHIGQGAVVAAGSVVMTDIPEEAVAAGNPARVIKYRQ